MSVTSAETYNDNPSYASIGQPHLDYFGGITRQSTDEEIQQLAQACLEQDTRLALATFFQKRDCRGGAGERKPFVLSFAQLPDHLRHSFYNLIPEYGYWQDLNVLARHIKEDQEHIADFFAHRLHNNMVGFAQGKLHHGLEKWLPTEKQKDDREWKAVQLILQHFNQYAWAGSYLRQPIMEKLQSIQDQLKERYAHIVKKAEVLPERIASLTPRDYRRWCSFMRAYYEVIEHYKCAGQWKLIDYAHVPSLAFDRTKQQFIKHDGERFSEFMQAVRAGDQKINVGRLMPFELVKQASSEERDIQWDLLVKETAKFYQTVDADNAFHPQNCIHVADVSGSMTFNRAGSARPLDIALSLTLLMSQIGKRDLYTFSATPKRYEANWNSLTQALRKICDNNYNTDLKALIDRIWQDCEQARNLLELDSNQDCTQLKGAPGWIPKTIFIYTDGGFDRMCHQDPVTAANYIQQKFGEHCPRLVFWNVAGNVKDFAVTQDHSNIVQLAGFSKDLYEIFTRLTDLNNLQPEFFFRQAVLSERYQPVLQLYDRLEW